MYESEENGGHWVFQNESLAKLAICWYLLTCKEGNMQQDNDNQPSFPFQNSRWIIRAINALDWTNGPAWPGPKKSKTPMERKYIILRNAGSGNDDQDFAVLRCVPSFEGMLEINFLQEPSAGLRTGFQRVTKISYFAF